MISWEDINLLEKKKLNLEIQLNELLKDKSASSDKANELKSEILYLDKQISKILGSNEIKRLESLKERKLGIDQRRIKNYYQFKDKYKKISKLSIAIRRMISILEKNNTTDIYQEDIIQERTKVKSDGSTKRSI